MRVARPAKRSTGGHRVAQGRVLFHHRASRGPNQSPRPRKPVRNSVSRCRPAMGTVCVQTQMLAAPSTVMTEQTVGGLVEHPEQPMAIDVANPHFRHNALVTPRNGLLSKSAKTQAGWAKSVFASHRPKRPYSRQRARRRLRTPPRPLTLQGILIHHR